MSRDTSKEVVRSVGTRWARTIPRHSSPLARLGVACPRRIRKRQTRESRLHLRLATRVPYSRRRACSSDLAGMLGEDGLGPIATRYHRYERRRRLELRRRPAASPKHDVLAVPISSTRRLLAETSPRRGRRRQRRRLDFEGDLERLCVDPTLPAILDFEELGFSQDLGRGVRDSRFSVCRESVLRRRLQGCARARSGLCSAPANACPGSEGRSSSRPGKWDSGIRRSTSRIPSGSRLAASRLSRLPGGVVRGPVPRLAPNTLWSSFQKIEESRLLLISEVHAVEPSGRLKGDVRGKRHSISAVVAEPFRDQDTLAVEVVGHSPFVLAVVLVIPMLRPKLSEIAVAYWCVTVVAAFIHDWCSFAPTRTLGPESAIRPILFERKRLIHPHGISEMVVELPRRNSDDPVSWTRLSPDGGLAARERAPAKERIRREA